MITFGGPQEMLDEQDDFNKSCEKKVEIFNLNDLKEAFKVNYTPFSFSNIGDFDKDFDKWLEQYKKKV